MPKEILEVFGPAREDGLTFVFPKLEAESILQEANGNMRKLEKLLGQPAGRYEGVDLVKVEFPNPKQLNIKIPSGNEKGANGAWLPGGKLPEGHSEAVLDLRSSPSNAWVSSPLIFN